MVESALMDDFPWWAWGMLALIFTLFALLLVKIDKAERVELTPEMVMQDRQQRREAFAEFFKEHYNGISTLIGALILSALVVFIITTIASCDPNLYRE